MKLDAFCLAKVWLCSSVTRHVRWRSLTL